MATRTTSNIVTFTKPFVLGDFDEVLPAGDYVVDTDEDLLQGLSFSAYLRVATIVHLPDKSGNSRLSRALTIDPHKLDKALARDQRLPKQLTLAGGARTSQPQLHRGSWSSADGLAMDQAENEGMRNHARQQNGSN
jgi:hypothetical protein